MPASSAAHRDEDGVDRVRVLAQDLDGDGALSRDHLGVVEGMHEHAAAALHEALRLLPGVVEGVAVQHDLGPQVAHRLDLDARRGNGHDDRGAQTPTRRRQRHALGVVAGRHRDHAAPAFVVA